MALGLFKQKVSALLRGECGQMTIELAVMLPVAIVIAVIAVNALTFFSECAAFDRLGRNAVRICASSPAYGQGLDQSIAMVETMLNDAITMENVECLVSGRGGGMGYTTFDLSMTYYPTLFGMGLKSEVFGVAMPSLNHSVSITLDAYKPGMLL